MEESANWTPVSIALFTAPTFPYTAIIYLPGHIGVEISAFMSAALSISSVASIPMGMLFTSSSPIEFII